MKRVAFTEAKHGVYHISERYPLAYINMPKCACTTIKNYMYYLDESKWFSEPLSIHRHLSDERGFGFVSRRNIGFTFTFVRHPVKRCFSAFHEKIVHDGEFSFPKVKGYIEKNYKVEMKASKDPEEVEFQFYKFLCFIHDNIRGKTKIRKDAHWIPQSMIIDKYERLRKIDFIGRIESFQSDFEFIMHKAGVSDLDTQKRFNEGPKPEVSLSEIRSERIQALCQDIFLGDERAFGYDLSDY